MATESRPVGLGAGRAWESERYLTAQSSAKLLRCSAQTVLNMLRDGRLSGLDRGVGVRPRWLVSRDSLNELVDRGPRASAVAFASDLDVSTSGVSTERQTDRRLSS